ARLIEFQLLLHAGVPMPAAYLLSDFYNRARTAYYRELGRTSKPPFSIDGFIGYAVRGFVDELREQLVVVRAEQLAVAWKNYVHERFREMDTVARRRQKYVVLDLPGDGRPVPVSRLPELSIRLAAAYAGKGPEDADPRRQRVVSVGSRSA
nr:hypothetical protein [Micromonospora sp. DSM 115978]